MKTSNFDLGPIKQVLEPQCHLLMLDIIGAQASLS